MHPLPPTDHAATTAVLAAIQDPTQRAFLDLLIQNPDERFDTAAVAERLGLADHRDVARATYAIGQALATLGFSRPWTEAQMGYAMPAETAILLQAVTPDRGA